MGFYGFLSFYGYLLVSKDVYGNLWVSMDLYRGL